MGKCRQMGHVLGLARQRENTERLYQCAAKDKNGGCSKESRHSVFR